MEIVVTSKEMRALDGHAIKQLSVPGSILMENAGRGVVDAMEHEYGRVAGRWVVVLCGKGNNGGDGFVVARHALTRGAKVAAVIVGKMRDIRGDAKLNLEILKKTAKTLPAGHGIRIIELKSSRSLRMLPKPDFLVDAVFGTGFSGAVRGIYRDVIQWANDSTSIKVSIDIPSGVNSDTGIVENIAFKANLTVTMGMKKIGLITGKSSDYVGRLKVVDLGTIQCIPAKPRIGTYIIEAADVRESLPHRAFDAHKHSVGKIYVIAGSQGLTGAAAMAAESGLRAGAGAVILGTPRSISSILARKLTEVMVEPLEETSDGSLSLRALEKAEKHIRWADVVVIGPGLSGNPETQQLVWKIVGSVEKPLLLDADALNALAANISILKRHKSREIIITPHSGELSRLIGVKSVLIDEQRVDIARDVAKKFKLTLVLKGAPTVSSSPRGEVYINATGNAGMATAGSGDVLSGIIAGLWAQGLEQTIAAYCGVYIHGLAGDLACKKFGEKSMMALDIQGMLPEAFTRVEGNE